MIVLRTILLILTLSLTAGAQALHAQALEDQSSSSLENIFARTIESSLQDWVGEITQFGGASGNVGSISTRSQDGALQMHDMSLDVPGLDLSIKIEKAVLERPRLRNGNLVAQADRITLSGFAFKQGQLEFATDEMVLEQTALPRLDIARLGATNSRNEKFERQRQFLAQVFSLQAEMISIPELAVRTYSTKKKTEILGESIYSQNVISNVKGQRIGQWNIARTLSLSPPLEPIVQESFEDASFTDLNINAFISLLNPSVEWSARAVILGGLDVKDYAVSIGGLSLNIEAIRLTNLTLEALDSDTKDNLVTIAKSPKGIDAIANSEVPQFLLNLTSAFDVGTLELEQLTTEALGIDYFTMQSLALSKASLGGFAKFDLQEFHASLTDLGAIGINGMTISNAELPDKDMLRSKLNGDPVSTADLLPTLTSMSLDGFEASVPELALDAGIQSFRLQTQTDNSNAPNGLAVTLEKLRVPTALIPEGKGLVARLTGILRSMETQFLELNQSLLAQYDAAEQTLTLEEVTIDIQKLGRVQLEAQIDGVTTSPFASPAQASNSIRKGKLIGSRITIDNYGIVEAGFEAQAVKLNTKGDVLRGQVGATLPFLVAVLQNQRFQNELVAALQAFLPDPEGLIIEMKPDAGVAIEDIERQLRGDPRKLLGQLGVTIQNKPDVPLEDTEQLPN